MEYFLDEIGTKYVVQKIKDTVRVMPCNELDEVLDGQVACVPVTGYQDEYLTLSALEDGLIEIIVPTAVDGNYATSLSYSKDKSSWPDPIPITNTYQSIKIPVSAGDDVYLRGEAKQWTNSGSSLYSTIINSTANFIVSGNAMSLLYGDDFKGKVTFPEGSKYNFRSLFQNNTHLINAENLVLPATTLNSSCYFGMFEGCTALMRAPVLPATTLASYCYQNMFKSCASLVAAPALPVMELKMNCYAGMFQGCTSLTTAPELPATTLATSCYASMFASTSLTTAPALPATTLASYCYNSMFSGCTSLTTAPELPATTLAQSCYAQMFQGCTSLTTAPELPAIELVKGCYYYMFQDCTSLTTAPELPATELTTRCYCGMFNDCSSLTTAPELPATTLAESCYDGMFSGCTSLTTAPELPATTLADWCYYQMFYHCSKLNSITMLATDISATNCLRNWVNGVSSTGTFTKAASMTTLPTGNSGIPSGWTVIDK